MMVTDMGSSGRMLLALAFGRSIATSFSATVQLQIGQGRRLMFRLASMHAPRNPCEELLLHLLTRALQ
jgi:hypothetical protein